MTPDERLREAVGKFLLAMRRHGFNDEAWDAFITLRDIYHARPCVNASEVIEKDRSWFGWFQRWRKKR